MAKDRNSCIAHALAVLAKGSRGSFSDLPGCTRTASAPHANVKPAPRREPLPRWLAQTRAWRGAVGRKRPAPATATQGPEPQACWRPSRWVQVVRGCGLP